MNKQAKRGNIVEFTRRSLVLLGEVVSVRDSSVIVDCTIMPNFKDLKIEERTSVNHKKYVIVDHTEREEDKDIKTFKRSDLIQEEFKNIDTTKTQTEKSTTAIAAASNSANKTNYDHTAKEYLELCKSLTDREIKQKWGWHNNKFQNFKQENNLIGVVGRGVRKKKTSNTSAIVIPNKNPTKTIEPTIHIEGETADIIAALKAFGTGIKEDNNTNVNEMPLEEEYTPPTEHELAIAVRDAEIEELKEQLDELQQLLLDTKDINSISHDTIEKACSYFTSRLKEDGLDYIKRYEQQYLKFGLTSLVIRFDEKINQLTLLDQADDNRTLEAIQNLAIDAIIASALIKYRHI